MRGFRTVFAALLVLAGAFLLTVPAEAGQLVSRSSRGVNAVQQARGYFLQPVGTAPMSHGDLAPQQLFELVRPNGEPVTLGRLYTSCVCVSLEADSNRFSAGEPVILRLRNVKATPQAGQMYAIYVQVTRPIRTTLRFDTFVRSSQFIPADVDAGDAPTRGNVVADGVLPAATAATAEVVAAEPTKLVGKDGIEIIIPRADTSVSDAARTGIEKADEKPVVAEATLSKKIIITEVEKKDTVSDGVLAAASSDRPKTISDALDRERRDSASPGASSRPEPDSELKAMNAKGIDTLSETIPAASTAGDAGQAPAGTGASAPVSTATLADGDPEVRAAAAALGQKMLDAPPVAAKPTVGATLKPAPADDLWATPKPRGPVADATGSTVDQALDKAARAGRDALNRAADVVDNALDAARQAID